MELPSFATYLVAGAGAGSVLESLFANRMPLRDGGVVLAHALSDQGRFLTEATITRLPGDRFLVLSGAYAHLQDLDMLRWAAASVEGVTVSDLTEAWTTLILAGPQARDVLSCVTPADLSNEAFPWLSGQEIAVAGHDVVAIRVNYVGELGWELHVPMAAAVDVYSAVWEAGVAFGIADFGLYAMNSLRLEKGYAGWGAELTAEITPAEAGMLRFVRFDHAFRGREALEARVAEGPAIHLVELAVDAADYDPRGGEPVYAGDAIVGVTTSGGCGHATGSSYAFAYVSTGAEAPGTALTVALLGERRPAVVLAEPPYDPQNLRLRS
jgi:dimethylglycine dehydrogenase